MESLSNDDGDVNENVMKVMLHGTIRNDDF